MFFLEQEKVSSPGPQAGCSVERSYSSSSTASTLLLSDGSEKPSYTRVENESESLPDLVTEVNKAKTVEEEVRKEKLGKRFGVSIKYYTQ